MTIEPRPTVDVAVVGGGPAGAALATRLARQGRSVILLERAPRWRWHACGVFASPAAISELRALGLDGEAIEQVARPISGMRIETPGGATFRLRYGPSPNASSLGGPVGFDREALDAALLELAAASGADVRRAHAVLSVQPSEDGAGELSARGPEGLLALKARVIVGADGIRSLVARQVGVARPARLGRRVGLTWHIPEDDAGSVPDARMVVLDGAYCGLAPVPGRRLNVGIVLAGRERLRALVTHGATAVGASILAEALGRPGPLDGPPDTELRASDTVAGAVPLGHRVVRRAGPGWLLVGDAAGFLDPFSGEGIHRALVSARLAAAALTGRSGRPKDLSAYDRAMRQRFAAKDLVSLIVQVFLAQPALFDYAARRLANRPASRETLGLVMADLVSARRALDPRFLAALLAP